MFVNGLLSLNEVKSGQERVSKNVIRFILEARVLVVLTVPIIYSVLFPALLLDLFASAYQFSCFPIYKIPIVKRKEYMVFDRRKLLYLNWIERINCTYCSYFNGLIAYVREIASRSEQYWCPIHHASQLKGAHSRTKDFVSYGDSISYYPKLEELRDKLSKE